jgi:DNA-binding CsgD family transcriptional regulator
VLGTAAERVRREVAALVAAGLSVTELHVAAIRLVGRVVGTDLTCWATLDPETLAISTMVSGDARIPQEYEPLLAASEYSGTEPHTFAELARRSAVVAKFSDLPSREIARSSRFNDVWRPLGLDRELRVTFRVDGACWGAAGLVRRVNDYSDREVEVLAAVAPAIAAATRVAVRNDPYGSPGGNGPAIVLAGPGGEVRAVTPAARSWQDRLDEIAPGRFLTMMRGARAAASGTFRMRLRDARGGWAILHASTLVDDDRTVVTIEPATGQHLIGMLIAAYGLTTRERDICHEVISGHSTSDIAGRLHITTHTVQDHLKSVFAKVGVRSRGELVARIRPDSPQ